MVSTERESRVLKRIYEPGDREMCILGGESEYGCVGSHILVNLPQSVLPLPCIKAGEIGIFYQNSMRDG